MKRSNLTPFVVYKNHDTGEAFYTPDGIGLIFYPDAQTAADDIGTDDIRVVNKRQWNAAANS